MGTTSINGALESSGRQLCLRGAVRLSALKRPLSLLRFFGFLASLAISPLPLEPSRAVSETQRSHGRAI